MSLGSLIVSSPTIEESLNKIIDRVLTTTTAVKYYNSHLK
jgi:hypothetical protein